MNRIILLLVLISTYCFSANRYWVGGTGNWNNTARWSATSGGAGGATVPTSSDDVFFDANSFTTTGQTVTINVSASCLNMNWTGIVNNPTLAGSSTLNIAGSLTLAAGLSVTYFGAITFSSTSTGKTITTNGVSLDSDINFNGAGGDWTLQDAFSLAGSIDDITITNGSLLLNNKSLTVGSVIVSGGVFSSATNNSTIVLQSSITGINVSSGTFHAGIGTLTLNGDVIVSGGTANLNSSTINGSFSNVTVSGGTLNTNSSIITLTYSNVTVSGGTFNWNTSSLTIDATYSFTLSGTGTLNTNNQNFSLAQFNYNGGTFNYGTSTMTIATFSVGGTVNFTTASNFVVTNYTANGGTINLGLNTTITGNVTATSGTFNTSNFTLSCASLICNGGTANLGSSTNVTATSTITVSSGTLNCNSSTTTTPYINVSGGTLALGTCSLNLTGSINNELTLNSSATVTTGASTITFTGANNTSTVPIHLYLGTKTVNNIVFSTGKFRARFFDGGTIASMTVPSNSWLEFEVSKTFTFTGNISTTTTCEDYTLITSTTPGTTTSISLSAGQPNFSNLQIRDITNSGTNKTCTSCVNDGTNSGFTFNSPRSATTLYWRGTGSGDGNWGTGTNWTENSDGTLGSNNCVPTIIDNVVFNAASFDNPGPRTVTIDKRVTVASINTTGAANSGAISNGGSYDIVITGNQTLTSTLGTITNSGSVFYRGSAAQLITCGTKRLSSGTSYFANPSTVYLEDDGYFGTVNLLTGTLDVRNQAGTTVNNLYFSGDWYRTGTFQPRSDNTKYTIFNGSNDGTIFNSTTFYNLKVTPTSSTYDLITGDNVTITNELLITAGTYKNTTYTTDVNGSVNITSANATSYLYNTSGATFNYNSNSTTGFNLAKGNIWAWGGTINVGIAGTHTTTVLNVGNAAGAADEAVLDLFSSGIVNVADQLLVKSDGTLWVESSGNTLNIKTNTTNGGTAGTSKFQINSGGIFKQSGGTINVLGSADNNTTNAVSFNTGATFTAANITGGTIVLRSTTSTFDYPVDFGGKTIFNLTVNQSGRTFKMINNSVTLKGSLTITAGTLDANAQNITLAGTWTNNSTYSNSGSANTVTFNGSSNQSIAGSSSTNFNNLTNNNSSTGITLNANIGVNATLNMNGSSGANINLNGRTIDLSSTGSITGETNTDRIYGTTGYITTTRNLSNISSLNVGGMGATLTTTADMGSTTIIRCHTPQVGLGNSSIARYFDINPTNNSSLDATLVFNYFDNELNGQTEANFSLYRSTDAGSTWIPRGGTFDGTGNTVSLASISAFSRWTVSNKTTNPLPVELLSFDAKKKNKTSELTWITKSEKNNQLFEIERSNNAIDFNTIGKLKGHGNTNKSNDYLFYDFYPKTGDNYYRLKQIDFDGNTTYSKVNKIYFEDSESIRISPNPFIDKINIEGEYEIGYLINSLGQIVLEFKPTDQINTENINRGAYSIVLKSKNGSTSKLLIKE